MNSKNTPLRQRIKSLSLMKNILNDCQELRLETQSFHTHISRIEQNKDQTYINIERKANSDFKDYQNMRNSVKLHNYLEQKIFESTQYKLSRPNLKAIKYVKREETLFDKNPVLYLKNQLIQNRKKLVKMQMQTRHFSIQQRKFIESLNNYN
ncbi:hypothetical protein pb186bvf_012315 [Paramecium bursaria]